MARKKVLWRAGEREERRGHSGIHPEHHEHIGHVEFSLHARAYLGGSDAAIREEGLVALHEFRAESLGAASPYRIAPRLAVTLAFLRLKRCLFSRVVPGKGRGLRRAGQAPGEQDRKNKSRPHLTSVSDNSGFRG